MTAKILVIDDDPETRKLIRMVMARKGYQLAMADSGAVGLEMAHQDRPDLLILDIMMPDMDGFEVCRRFRSSPALSTIPIIMFTAKDRPEDRQTGFLVGADEYLTKPTMPNRLLEVVQEHLTHHVSDAVPPPPPVDAATVNVPHNSQHQPGSFFGVVGSRGGAGATTTAINLAISLAHAGHNTILADFDLSQGHVARYLNQRPSRFVEHISSLATASLQNWLVPYQPNLALLCAAADQVSDRSAITNAWWAQIGNALVQDGRVVVADLGHGITPDNRAILPFVTDLIICLRPERLSLIAVPGLLQTAPKLMRAAAATHILMLDYEGNQALPQEAIEQNLRHPLIDIITLRSPELAQATNRGRALVDTAPDSAAAQRFRDMARQLVAA